jgi:hypothetical protein
MAPARESSETYLAGRFRPCVPSCLVVWADRRLAAAEPVVIDLNMTAFGGHNYAQLNNLSCLFPALRVKGGAARSQL